MRHAAAYFLARLGRLAEAQAAYSRGDQALNASGAGLEHVMFVPNSASLQIRALLETGTSVPKAPVTSDLHAGFCLRAARRYLRNFAGDTPDPLRALGCLEAVREYLLPRVGLASGQLPDGTNIVRSDRDITPLRRQFDLLESRAHLLLGHAVEARAALERVEAQGIVDRELLDLRRDMASLKTP